MTFTKEYQTILSELKNEILYITINRPDKLNALSQNVLTEMKDLLQTIMRDVNDEFRGIILTGSGEKAFIAGADIKAMQTMSSGDAEAFCKLGQEVTVLLEEVSVPVIACVNGFALGGGCEVAMACDFIYATENAVFGQPEVNLGLIPGFGGTQRLMRYVGLPMSRELIYTGRNVKIEEAQRIGLAQKTFSTKEEMITAAEETIGMVKKKSPLAVAKCKEVINKGEANPLSDGLNTEAEGFKFIFGTEDKKEGVAAFLEKRKPVFPGK